MGETVNTLVHLLELTAAVGLIHVVVSLAGWLTPDSVRHRERTREVSR